jgi:NAD dependent epimerase/dehydratase family enzyme
LKVFLTGSTGFIGAHLKRIEPKLFKCVIREDRNTSFEDSYTINDLNECTDWSDA